MPFKVALGEKSAVSSFSPAQIQRNVPVALGMLLVHEEEDDCPHGEGAYDRLL